MFVRNQTAEASRAVALRRAMFTAAVGAACATLAGASARADTVHRYSFNTPGQAEDTGTMAGGTDGTIVNGATVSGGQLNTAGGGSGAASTAPGVTLSPIDALDVGSGDFSIESYFTRGAAALNNYSTLFSFSAGNTNNYINSTPGRGDGGAVGVSFKQVGVNGGAELVLRGPVLAAGSTHVLATSFNSASGTATLYIDGVSVNQSRVGQLTGLNFSNLGAKDGINNNSPFGDPGLIGSTNEFRLDNNALTATQAVMNFYAGPDNTGTALVVNNGTASGDYNDGTTYSQGTPTAGQYVIINNTKTLSAGTGAAGLLGVNSTGTLNVNGGTLTTATNLDLTAGATVNLNGGILNVRGITADGDNLAANTSAHTVNLNGGTLQAGGQIFAGASNITYNVATASTIDTNGNSFTLGGQFTGTGAINKIGAGTFTFAGTDTGYTGRINLNAGTLGLALPSLTGVNTFSSPIAFDSNNLGTAGLVLNVDQTVATNLTSTLTLGQPTAATSYAFVGGAGTNQNLNFTGKITGGNANTTLLYGGNFKLDVPTSDYAGNTQINGGTSVALAGPASFGGANRALIFNGGGIEPQTATSLTGANRFVAPVTVTANSAIYFNGVFNLEDAGSITGTLASGASVSDIQKTGAGTLTLSGTDTNIRNVVLNGTGGTAATPRIVQFASNFTGANPSTDNVATGVGTRGGIVDDGQGGNNDVQFVDLTNNVTVSNLVLASKGRSLAASPLVAGIVLNSSSGNNTFGGGLEIVNGGGGQRVNVAGGSNLTVGGIVNNNFAASNRAYELTGAGNGTFTGTLLDGTQYNATTQAASQLSLTMIGETTGTATTGNGTWSINSTGNTLSGGINVINGGFFVNGSTTSTSTAASNVVGVYGGSLGGVGSIAQPTTVYAAGATGPGNFLSLNPASTTSTALGGTLSPGNATTPIGTLTFGKTVAINGTLAEQYDGTGAGSADDIAVAGALTLGSGSALNLSNLNAPANNSVYVLANYGSLSGTFGTVTGVPTGYALNYVYKGNEIALVAPPLYFTGSSSGSLNTAGNYSTDLAGANVATTTPVGGTDVFFASTNGNAANLAAATLASNLTVNSVTFGTGATAANPVTISGSGTLTINAGVGGNPAGTGIVVQSGAAAVTINANVALAASQSWTNNSANTFTVGGGVNLGANTLTLAGTGRQTISGTVTGTGGLVATDTGTLVLSGANTYTGGTTISAGTRRADNATSALGTGLTQVNGGTLAGGTKAAPGATGGNVTVNAGGTLTAGTGATPGDTLGTLGVATLNANGGQYTVKLDGANSSSGALKSGTAGANASDLLTLSGLTTNGASSLTINPVPLTSGANVFTSATPGTTYSFVIADDTASKTAFDGLINQASRSAIVVNNTNPAGRFALSTLFDGNTGEDLLLDFTTTAAPEPTSLLLAGIAAAPLALGRRRRRAAVAV